MSNSYFFVDSQIRKDCAEATTFLETLKKSVMQQIADYVEAHPTMAEALRRSEFALSHSEGFFPLDYHNDESQIGTATSSHFYWGQNFSSKDEVAAFAAEHPTFVIENEYQDIIPLSDFLASI